MNCHPLADSLPLEIFLSCCCGMLLLWDVALAWRTSGSSNDSGALYTNTVVLDESVGCAVVALDFLTFNFLLASIVPSRATAAAHAS